MDRTNLMADLAAASAIAKDGAHTPLLGGPIGLMWGCLLVPTLTFHGLTLLGKTPMDSQQIGLVWAAYGVIGTVLSIILGRRIDRKAGAGSVLNRLSGALGTSMGIMIFAYAITTVIAVLTQGLPTYMYNLIIVFGFGIGAVNGAVLGAITRLSFLRWSGIAAASFMVICLLMVTRAEVYFVAALGIVLTQILPSLVEMKQERAHAQ